jgi:TolB-like protein
VRRFRIAYEKEPIKSNVDSRIGEKSSRSVAPTAAISMLLGEKANTTQELNPRRVAILPFVSMSSDPNDEYFADGLTEELISRISLVSRLEVIARTSVMGFKENRDWRR